jgi:hypothetical protein
VPRTEVHRRDDLDAELVARELDEFLADVALERLLQVIRIPKQIRRSHERPGRDLPGDVRRSEVGELEIAALERDEFRALLEQRVAPVEFKLEIVLQGCGERLVALCPQVALGEGR